MAVPDLKRMIEARKFFVAPGVQDMIAAVIAKQVGFPAVYASGYWLTASCYGLPDAGLVTMTQMLDRVGTLCRTLGSQVPVIADADTGFGGLLNVHHTVLGYAAAGVSAIQIEDQEFPKKCGHTPFKRVIAQADMCDKIRVAVEAAADSGMLVIARTDAYASEGFDRAVERARRYGEAGADIVFVEALTSEAEMRRACELIEYPMIANMADGGKTPILPATRLEELGYACAIFPAMSSLAAAAAMRRAFENLKATGTSLSSDIPQENFNAFCSLIGFEEVWAFERKWVQQPG